MRDLMWPTIERALVAALKPILPAFTEAPKDLAGHAPLIIVQQTPGAGESGAADLNPRADIDLIAATRREVNDLVPDVLQALINLRCASSGGVYFDDVRIVEDFGFIPYADLDLRRATALVQFTVRPQP